MDPRQLDPKDFDSMDETMAEIYRGMTGVERLQVWKRLWKFARRLIEADVRENHPDWQEEEIQMETGRRMLSGTNQR